MKKKVALHNLGCKVNAYEVEAMQQLLENAGYETVPFEEGADVYVINTCTVTNIADRKSRQMLHKAKKMNPDAIVVATGCYAQADTEKLKEDTAVDLILGNNQKTQIVEALEEYEKEHAKQVQVIEINQTKEYEELSIVTPQNMYVPISKSRMDATSSVLTVSSRMQEAVCAAERSQRSLRKYVPLRQEVTKKLSLQGSI